jgi:hypothetical protein
MRASLLLIAWTSTNTCGADGSGEEEDVSADKCDQQLSFYGLAANPFTHRRCSVLFPCTITGGPSEAASIGSASDARSPAPTLNLALYEILSIE